MNKWNGIGRLAANPELKQTQNGISVVSFSIAVDRRYSGKDNEKQTDWLDIVAWRSTAEFICKYFHKGDPIIISGSLQTRTYEKDGVKRKIVEIYADGVEFVPKSHSSNEGEKVHGAPEQFSNVENDDFASVENDDLPF